MQLPTPTRVVLVTGASRGIGAAVAQGLASPDTHVIVNYRENAKRATAVADAIRNAGGQASTMAADISDEDETGAMLVSIATRFGRLDALVLNASGGLELGADTGHAMRRNGDAQRRLARLSMPIMSPGARVVFVTSHQAHFYPHKAVPKGYAAAAASKRAGETALYGMRSEFDHAGIRFSVVSGDMIDGTIDAGEGFATAIVHAATAPNPPGIVYARGADYLMTA